MEKTERTYAKVEWTAEDIQILQSNWSVEQCERWLAANAERIESSVTQYGWGIISMLLEEKDHDMDGQRLRSMR